MSFLDNTGVQNLVNDLKAKTDAAYQKTLASGTNIKTVNGNSLLGSGDLEISGGAQTTWWGTSSTSAGTATKVVVCEGFTLTAGAIISILFSAGNEAAVPTLNVNSTGEIPIRIGDSAPSRSNNTLKWSMGSVLTFVYDGTYFRYLGAKTAGTQTQPEGAGSWYGTSSTAATYSAKFCVVSTFRKTQGAIVTITFSTANTYINGALTLNIDSTGASTIYVNNVATSASNTLLWDAGETLTFVYSGQYYYFVGRNKASGGSTVSVQQTLTSGTEKGGITVDGVQTKLYAPSGGGGGTSGWTNVSYSTDGNDFFGNVIKNDHLCVIVNEGGGTTFSEFGTLLTGLPEPFIPVYFTVSNGQGFIPVTIADGQLVIVDMETLVLDEDILGFTLVYPI